MTFLVNWTATDHAKSAAEFTKHESTADMVAALGTIGINVKESGHIFGTNRGVLIVSAEPVAVQEAMLLLGTQFGLEITVEMLLSDAEAKKSLAAFKG